MIPAIIAIWAGRAEDGPPTYFTSTVYPIAVNDSLSISLLSVQAGSHWGLGTDTLSIGLPAIVGGALADTIVYKTYTSVQPDTLSLGLPAIVGGTLLDTIVYKTYTSVQPDTLSLGLPAVLSGTLPTTIAYISYTTVQPDTLSIGLPAVISGSLT